MAVAIGGTEAAPPTGNGPRVKTTHDLMLEAGDSAAARGHRMSIFTAVMTGRRTIMRSVCRECDAWVDVTANPLPNEVEIGGDAVAVSCERDGVPVDFPVRPLAEGEPAQDRVTCGACGRSWDDAVPTSYTPAPSARCPFETFHDDPE